MLPPPSYLQFDPVSRHVRLNPHSPEFVQNPYGAYAWMHAEARTFFWEDYGFWCFVGFEEVTRLLKDRRLGRERAGGYLASVGASGDRGGLAAFDRVEAHSLLELEPPDHTRLRTLVNRAFVSRQVERLRPKIETLANALIDRMIAAGGGDLIADYATPLPAQIIAEMMGLPAESGPQLVAWSNNMVRMYVHDPSPADAMRANASAQAFADFVSEHIDLRRTERGDDLLSVLVAANSEGERISNDEIVSSAILILNAGHEATVHQTGNAVKAILEQGGDPRRFFSAPSATTATVEECLRFDTPLHMFRRHVYEKIDVADGLVLRPGDKVGLLLGAANHDPQVFDRPAQFDPVRAVKKTASFGAGIHFCVGAPLARLELQVALETLFRRLPALRLSDETAYRDSYHFRGLKTLKASLTS